MVASRETSITDLFDDIIMTFDQWGKACRIPTLVGAVRTCDEPGNLMACGAPSHRRIAGYALGIFKKQSIAAMAGESFHGAVFPVKRTRENPNEPKNSFYLAVQTIILINQEIETPVLVVKNSSEYCPGNELPFLLRPVDFF